MHLEFPSLLNKCHQKEKYLCLTICLILICIHLWNFVPYIQNCIKLSLFCNMHTLFKYLTEV